MNLKELLTQPLDNKNRDGFANSQRQSEGEKPEPVGFGTGFRVGMQKHAAEQGYKFSQAIFDSLTKPLGEAPVKNDTEKPKEPGIAKKAVRATGQGIKTIYNAYKEHKSKKVEGKFYSQDEPAPDSAGPYMLEGKFKE
jgi:hypothetical protein